MKAEIRLTQLEEEHAMLQEFYDRGIYLLNLYVLVPNSWTDEMAALRKQSAAWRMQWLRYSTERATATTSNPRTSERYKELKEMRERVKELGGGLYGLKSE